MNAMTDVSATLSRMTQLLRGADELGWARALENIEQRLPYDPEEVARSVLRLFGGMGSLNDVVLYRNGSLLLGETDEFDALRTHLFEACVSLLH